MKSYRPVIAQYSKYKNGCPADWKRMYCSISTWPSGCQPNDFLCAGCAAVCARSCGHPQLHSQTQVLSRLTLARRPFAYGSHTCRNEMQHFNEMNALLPFLLHFKCFLKMQHGPFWKIAIIEPVSIHIAFCKFLPAAQSASSWVRHQLHDVSCMPNMTRQLPNLHPWWCRTAHQPRILSWFMYFHVYGTSQCTQGHWADVSQCWPAHIRARANVSPMTLCALGYHQCNSHLTSLSIIWQNGPPCIKMFSVCSCVCGGGVSMS